VRIIYFVRNITISGGVKVLSQHVRLLRRQGVDAQLLTLRDDHPGYYGDRPEIIVGTQDGRLDADVSVATKPSDVMWLFRAQRGRPSVICHLCQGDDIGDLRTRLRQLLRWKNVARAPVPRLIETVTLYQRLRRYEASYRLPTRKMAVSAHLCQLIQTRFRQLCVEIPNGVDPDVFCPGNRSDEADAGTPWRIVSVGRFDTEIKGIADVLAAIAWLKQAGYAIHLTRIAGEPITVQEQASGIIDQYWQGISEQRMADILRASHVLIAGSREAEGFGLSALEAMACGVPCVLTAVPCYVGLDSPSDYAHFVPPRRPRALADGILEVMHDVQYRSFIIRRGLDVSRRHVLAEVGSKLASFFSGLAGHEQVV